MPASPKNPSKTAPTPRATAEREVVAKPAPAAHSGETGWLPDYVYTGDKFEAGMAFFADALGRITRFSREPADLAIARRLAGQAALPGLVNGHSVAWQRVLRGRTEQKLRAGTDDIAAWWDARDRVAARLQKDDVFEAARMAFNEMLLAGITCVGEFHDLPHHADAGRWPERERLADEILRAAHDVGIRIAFFNVASLRSGGDRVAGTADAFLKETEALRTEIAGRYAPDEAWLGVAPESLGSVPLDAFKVIASYAHAQRMRLQTRVAVRPADVEACRAEHGRTPLVLLSEHGVVDKRFTAIHGTHLTDDECRLLGTARAALCACPVTEQNLALGLAPVDKVLAAGGTLALGTGNQTQTDLLKDARLLEYAFRASGGKRPALAAEIARALFHAATFTGARSLGATGGALEVGRPADFFTVNLYDPSIAGADPDTLLANVVFALERRAIREVWIGARQRIANGRHSDQGLIVGRFVDLQKRLWSAG